jgi:hypothetical protein
MHGQVNLPAPKRLFNVFDKQAFTVELGQRITPVAIPSCPNDHVLGTQPGVMRAQGLGNPTRLPQRQGTTARAETYQTW